ncbi:MAG TPA: mechanosensitive ion channel domain-containing protein [Gammaproteobacteria bacterium]
MKAVRPTLLLPLVLGLLVATAAAQEAGEPTPPELPDLASLGQTWWSYFEGTQEELGPRIEAFLEQVNAEIADLGAQNQELAPALVEAVRDNFEVYVSLLDDVDIQREPLPELAEAYSLDDLLDAAATARGARTVAQAAQDEVEREQRTRDGVTRRRDAVFKNYLDAAEGDARWLAALRVVRARSALAISQRRLQILTESARYASTFADEAAERVELVRERLSTDADEAALEGLAVTVMRRSEALADAEERQREALIAASSLEVDTAQGRSQQRLQQQLALDADVDLAAARVALGIAEARRFWTELKVDANPDLGRIEDTSLGWSELVRELSEQLPDWERTTQDELLAVQGVDRDGLDRDARRVLDQRIGTAQETLAHVGTLGAAVADLELLMTVVDDAVAEYSGPFRLWLYNVGRSIKTGWIRVTELTDTTLFSVGETPVTIGAIVQALVILLIAWVMSQATRYAIRRVGRKESVGTQASLYTLSRLTHYTIIIVAVLIALTSIGLDFTNLALVAGALSVGIGFGLQSIVNNFVSGLIILFERSLRVGDYIELDNGLTGTVKAISVRSTLINTNDNIDIVVPNSEFVTTRLTNWTLGEHILRVRIPFGVAYGSDKELVRKAAIEACDEVPYTLTHMPGREPDVWLVEYGDSSLNFLLLVWVNRQGARRPTRTRAAYLWALETKLSKYGIEIPFPQRDLHLKSGWKDAAPETGA